MGKMATRKVRKLVDRANKDGRAVGFVHGLEAAAGMKSIAQVRAAAKEGRQKLDGATAPTPQETSA